MVFKTILFPNQHFNSHDPKQPLYLIRGPDTHLISLGFTDHKNLYMVRRQTLHYIHKSNATVRDQRPWTANC